MVQPVSSSNAKKTEFLAISAYREALAKFSHLIETASEENRLTLKPENLVDEYFEYVSYTGRPSLPWNEIRVPFAWMIERKIHDMHTDEIEEELDVQAREQLKNSEYIRSSKEFILLKASSFDGTPFTIQRLCELITTPTRHYRVTEKYLRALEKNINVVTTVTETGDRISGIDAFDVCDLNLPIPVERNFIVSVDELDEPILENGVNLDKKQMPNGNEEPTASDVKTSEASSSETSEQVPAVKEDTTLTDADANVPTSSGPDEETVVEAHSSSEAGDVNEPSQKSKESDGAVTMEVD